MEDDTRLTEEELRSALISQSDYIYDFYDVERFLANQDLYKYIGTRFICWLIRFNIIPAARSSWVARITSRVDFYRILVERFFKKNFDTPLESLSKDSRFAINADLHRTKHWFAKFCEQIGIHPEMIQDSELRVSRLLATIGLENQTLSYTQGHDRYAWVCYAVSIYFVQNGGLNPFFAEAMSFYLARSFIENNPTAMAIESLPKLETRFHRLDEMVDENVPNAAMLLRKSHQNSMHYALKWEITLFACDHRPLELMWIWDRILVHIDDIGDFTHCLCVAHISQVPLPQMDDEMAQSIQRFSQWNVVRIVQDAETIFTKSIDRPSTLEVIRRGILEKCCCLLK